MIVVNDHEWKIHTFKNAPAMKCKHCGFIWQPHMRVPRVSCETIKERKRKP